jgi:ornithine carbamoyltransferase
MHVRVAGPASHQPSPAVLARARQLAAEHGGSAVATDDPAVALAGADVVATDTWVSMGMETDKESRTGGAGPFTPYQVNDAAMALAAPEAVFLHCLPAYRGLEVTASVIDGPASAVWDEAENRLHAQKALISFLLRQHRARGA